MVTATDEAELARQMEKAEVENAEVAGDDDEEEEDEDDDDRVNDKIGKHDMTNGRIDDEDDEDD